MVGDPEHPITTPKGQTVLTVLLTVMATLAPFFGSFGFALFSAAVAVAIILWLFQAELFETFRQRTDWRRIIAPVVSIILIFSMVLITTRTVADAENRTNEPAMTLGSAAETIASVADFEENDSDFERKPAPTFEITYRAEPVTDKPVSDPSPSRTQTLSESKLVSDLLSDTRKKVNAMSAGREEYWSCITARSKASGSLAGLSFAASQHQNAYYYGRDSKMMVANLNSWMQKVRETFEKNSDVLPSVAIVEMARPAKRANNFLGIDNAGDNAWAEMDAKEKVLSALRAELDDKKVCDRIRDSAIAQCVRLGQCEPQVNEPQKKAEISEEEPLDNSHEVVN